MQKRKTISDHELLQFNKLGCIPGPEETEEAFLLRMQAVREFPDPDSDSDNQIPSEHIQEACQRLRRFDIDPDWIMGFYRNKGLRFWEGGCTWIVDGVNIPVIQLRASFQLRSSFLGIYDRSELLAHELCHYCRCAFDDPRFEEFLAYQTSRHSWRRWLGGLPSSPIVSGALWGVTLIGCAILPWMTWMSLAALSVLWGGVGVSIVRKQREFSRCLQNLTSVCKEKEKACAVIFRLTDSEIVKFSRMDPQGIVSKVEEWRGDSLRWRMIALAYFRLVVPPE